MTRSPVVSTCGGARMSTSTHQTGEVFQPYTVSTHGMNVIMRRYDPSKDRGGVLDMCKTVCTLLFDVFLCRHQEYVYKS